MQRTNCLYIHVYILIVKSTQRPFRCTKRVAVNMQQIDKFISVSNRYQTWISSINTSFNKKCKIQHNKTMSVTSNMQYNNTTSVTQKFENLNVPVKQLTFRKQIV